MFAKEPARVAFTVDERCLPDATFDCAPSKIDSNPDKWPDVPWDLNCEAGSECGLGGKGALAPTFWTRKRLTKITTKVRDDTGAFRDVESWSFTHRWGDADVDRSLLLTSLVHTGLAATTGVSLPPVTFDYVQRPNRVDKAGDDIPPYIKYRLSYIADEFGGQIDVNYSNPECTLAALPTPQTNTKRCFPVYWSKPGQEDPARDWFHKYVTNQVIRTDRTGGSPDMITRYEYLGDPAWHYDTDNGITKEKYKTWGQWRGYGHVRVMTGGVDEGMLTRRDTLYLRGMDGDRADPSGGTKSVTVRDGEGGTYTDHEAWAGFELKTSIYDAPGGTVLEKTVNKPWRSETASRTRPWGTTTANLTGTRVTHGYTLLGDGTWRKTSTTTNTFDDATGLITKTDDRGDTGTAADNLCTRYTYAQDTSAWMLNFPAREQTVAAGCDVTPDLATQLVSDERTYYDGGALGDPPTKGDVTKTDRIASHDGTTGTYVKVASTSYDNYGRPTAVTNAAGHTATTDYTETYGLTTQVTTTSPPVIPGDSTTSLVNTTAIDPAFGQPVKRTDPNNLVTHLRYDALGRLLKVWLPDANGTDVTPNYEYSYHVSEGAIVAVGVKKLNARGGQKREAFQLFDGWLRERQTQVPGPDGGRLITDTFYDSRGNVAKTYDSYYATGSPVTALFAPDAPNVETQHWYEYDGLNRVTAKRLLVGNGTTQEKWRTTYSYTGDRTTVTPPAGGTPVTTITDARDRTIERREYKNGAPTGDYVSTTYTYTPAGQLATVTDTTGANTWRYHYDLRGRKTSQDDPDAGTTSYTYDDLDRLVTSTDARGRAIWHGYDPLGRETETRVGSETGALLTSRLYDTLREGQLTSATRYIDGQPYTTRINYYDRLYRPLRTTITIPDAAGPLAGSYIYNTRYNLDGMVQSTGFPAAGDLGVETMVHTYDDEDLGRLVKLGGYVTNTSYSLTGKPLQIELSTGGPAVWITNSYQYGTQRLEATSVTRANINGLDRHATYSYDPAGNITAITDVNRDRTDNQCFTYDGLRRLTQAWTQDTKDCAATPSDSVIGGPAPYWHTYRYNDTGNRTSQTNHGLAGADDTVRNYAYPAAGQPQPHTLSSVTETVGEGDPVRTDTYKYNAAGYTTDRTLAGGNQTLTWDTEGHLSKVTNPDGTTTSFSYDAGGNRLLRRDPTGVTLYLPGQELHYNPDTGQVATTRYYTHLGKTIATRTADGVQFVATDHHNTGKLQINATTQDLTRRRHTPFGEKRSLLGTWTGEKSFVGGTHDRSTSLTHLGAREYDPTTGRFISVDPLIDHGDSQQVNGYTYSNNNPITYTDPDGLILSGGTDENGRQILDPDPSGNRSNGQNSGGRDSGSDAGGCNSFGCMLSGNAPSQSNPCAALARTACDSGAGVRPPAKKGPRRPSRKSSNSRECEHEVVGGVCLHPDDPQVRDSNLRNGSDKYAAILARRQGLSCEKGESQVICYGYAGAQPMTVGDVLFYPGSKRRLQKRIAEERENNRIRNQMRKYGDEPPFPRRDILEHERRHSEQWANEYVANQFLLKYGAASLWSWLKTGNTHEENVYEIEAGLDLGGY